MQGQEGQGNFYFNNANDGVGVGSDHQPNNIVVPNGLGNDGHGPIPLGWINQSGSPLGAQNHVNFGHFIADNNVWLASPLGDQQAAARTPTNQDPNFLHNGTSIISPSSTFNPFANNNISMNPQQAGNNNVRMIRSDGPIGPSAPSSSVLAAVGQDAGGSAGQIQRNLDMNVAAVVDEGSTGTDASGHNNNGPYISLDFLRSPRTSPAAAAGDSGTTAGASSPVMIYSGSAGYVLEENINREGLPTDPGQRRLLCKRRAPAEFASASASGQVTSGEQSSSSTDNNSGGSSSVAAQDNNNNNNVMMMINSRHNSGGVVAAAAAQPAVTLASNFYHQSPYDINQAAGMQVDNFQRNTRLRTTAPILTHQQNSATPVNLWTTTLNNSNVLQQAQATGGLPQSSVYTPYYGRYTVTSSALALPPAPVMQQPTNIVQISNNNNNNNNNNPFVAPQPNHIWNAANVAQLAGGNSSAASSHQLDQAANIRETLEQYNRRNNVMMMMTTPNWGANNYNMQQANQQQLYLANNNANVIGNNNIASASTPSRIHQPVTNSGMYLQTNSTSAMSRYPQPNLVERYAQRVQEIIDSRYQQQQQQQQQQQGNYNYCPPFHANNMVDVSMRGGNVRSSQVPPLRIGPQRQVARPNSETSAAAQRRRRLVSEVRNALQLVRRPRGIRIEDVMLIDPSFLYADVHDNMRLDVDNMSYEELLSLEEQIGDVSTGLSEESILANLRRRKYQPITTGPPTEAESCCICQEDYGNGEELGKLDCGHDFHFNCIKQWLVQKNSCPICKKTALANI